MKLTNNAIKFLMAQYRAIFKNAYFKGLTSAVLLTAGLAVAGGAQAATNIDSTNWGQLTTDANGVTTVTGEDSADGTSGSYTDFSFNTSGTGITTDVEQYIKITGQSGSNVVSASGAEVHVTGTNTTIELNASTAASGALAIKASGANAATLTIRDLKVGVGQLTIGEGAATKAATLEALNTIDLLGGTGSKIIFSGSGADTAILQGRLTSSSTDTDNLTTLDFTGNGTLKTYGTNVNTNITVAAEKDAVLDLSHTDSAEETAENQLLQLTGGTFSLSGSATAGSGASFTIEHGTLEIGDNVILTATTESTGAGELVVSGSTTADATLRISSAKLKSFLVADKADGSTDDKAGAVTVQSGSIYLTDSTKSTVDLADGFTFSGTASTAGAIAFAATDGGVIAGDKLAVSAALTGADNANIEATTLTLGSETYDSTAGTGFGFKSATTQSLNLVQDADVSGAFVLKDDITLKATQQVDNIYTEASGDKITIAGQGGNIANTDLKLNGGTSDLTVGAGHYTGNVDIEIQSGSLTVGLGSTNAGDVKGIDASLTFAAGTTLTLNNADTNGGENTITVEGNGDADPAWATGLTRSATSTLDLRQANIAFTSDSAANPSSGHTKLTTINVKDGGELLVTEDQMNYLLNNIRNARASTISGAGFVLSGDGAVIVDGDLTVDASELVSGGTATTDTIQFNGGGVLEADSLTITDNPDDRLTDFTATTLNIGSGDLVAETIALNNNHLVSATAGLQDTFTVKDGDLYVGSSLTSVNSKVALGDGTSGASLTLGYISNNYDQYGIALPETEENAYTLSAETGTVQPNLVLSGGTTGQESALNVVYGDWTIQDLTASSAKIEVGSTSPAHDIDGNAYTTSLTGQGLTLNGGVTMNVHDNATAEFETLALNGGAINVNNTTLTINGKYVAPVEDNTATTDKDETVAESWGLSATTGSTVTVKGREAKLVLGADAVKSISTTKNADGVYEYTNKNAAQNAFVALDDWATLSLALGNTVTFDETSLNSLRDNFVVASSQDTTTGLIKSGFIDIGEAQIAGIDTSTGTISWDKLEGYKDIIADILQNGLTSATLIDVNASDTIQANVGNVLADASTPVLNFGDTTLHQADANGNFISNEAGTEVDANVIAGAHFAVYNGGNLADVTLQGGTTTSTSEFAVIASATEGAAEPETTIKSVTAAADNTSFYVNGKTTVSGNVDVGEVVLAKDLTVTGKTYISEGLHSDEDASGNLVTTGTLTTNDTLEVLGGTDFAGNIVANNTATFGAANGSDTYSINGVSYQHDYYFAGNNTFKNVNLYNGAEFDRGVTTAETMTLGDDLALYGGASVKANVLQFTTAAANTGNNWIYVGEPAGKDEATGEEWESSNAYLTVGRLDLAGNTLVTDPDWSKPASIVAIGQLGSDTAVTSALGNDAGTLDGALVALQNSILAVGVTDSTETDGDTAIEQIQQTFATYLNDNGALSADGVGAIAYVAKAMNLGADDKIVVDASRNAQQYQDLMEGTNTNPSAADTAFKNAVTGNNAYIGANSVLAFGNAALNATRTDGTTITDRAALHFDDDAASIFGAGGKIVLTGGEFNTIDQVLLFTDNGTGEHNGVTIAADGQDIRVESLSGLYYMTLEAGTETTGGELMLNHSRLNEVFTAASTPVKHSLVAYAERNNNWADGNARVDRLVGDLRRDVTYNPTTNTFTDANGATLDSNRFVAIEQTDGAGTVTGYTVYDEAYNAVLDYTVMYDASGATAETTARMGAYAGVAQAALAAGASTYDSISSRMGIGAQSSTMTFAENGQGAGLWLNPIYKSHDSDGFDAEGVDYGVDMDLYGVALGADYTLANGLRFGAMFNVGSGDADGQGAGSAVSNDFDYYGFGAFVGYTMGAFSVVGDVSYTAVDNDVEANLPFDKVGASLDSTNFSVGVTGKYELDFNGLSVAPHAGLRYSSIDIDDYSVDGQETYAHFSAQSMDVFSIPVGVTIAKDIVAGSWTVKPSFDLTLTGNFGDDEFEGDVNWEGVSNLVTQTSTEVLDNFTYGATLGVAAKTGNFSLGLGVNYTGSSNTDEFGVNANARFVF